jgi:hypothetical protein
VASVAFASRLAIYVRRRHLRPRVPEPLECTAASIEVDGGAAVVEP